MASKLTTVATTSDKPELIVSFKEEAPYFNRIAVGATEEQYTGFVVDLLREVARLADFNYKFRPVADGKYGAQQAHRWNGVIGEVVDGTAHIGAGALTVTSEREEVVDFTKPFMSNSVNLLVQKPSWTDLGLGYLVRPFSADYWIMLLVALLLIGIVFFIIGKFSPYEWGNVAADRDPRGAKNSFTLRNSYLFALSTITWQGFREAPHSLSGRIMAAFWWMFVLFSLIAYTANLTAFFLARPEQMPQLPFKTYEDLVANSDLHVMALNFGSTQKLLYGSHSETLKRLWSKMNAENSFVSSYTEGVERVKKSKGKFVMMMESASAEYYARQNCDIMVYGDDLFPSSMGFVVQKNSVWRRKINEAMDKLNEQGFVQQLKDKYWRQGGECSGYDGRKYMDKAKYLSSMPIYPITLKDMAVAILLLFLGFIASMVFLVIEIIHYAVTKKGKKIERPKILKNPPKIFRPKTKAAKAGPTDVELGGEAGPSSDGLESVPLEDAEDLGATSGDELQGEDEGDKKA
ncbi:glutamate receptor 3-like isoform X2 [Physella acuta]|uniref:glutamate receptor 3-like isoform X2 n=1 Tax=Physella acuta TaxID=109671 RepID=UPI0027DE2BF0|nr:glutamate receptor 3-like isoform X2 [Physella acuta]